MKKIAICLLLGLVCFSFVPVKSVYAEGVTPCVEGTLKSSPISGNPPVEAIPTLDYSPDGLLQFHFLFKPEGWLLTGHSNNMGYGHFDSACNFAFSTSPPFTYSSAIPSEHRVVARATQVGPNLYNFIGYNEDTNQVIPNAFGALPPPFSGDEIINIGFSSAGNFGSADPIGLNVVAFSTPSAQVKIVVAPVHVPVLVVPGILGTKIKKGDDTLWPDPARMLGSPDDRFMDPLQFREDGTPLDTSLTLDGVVDKAGNTNYTQRLVDDFLSKHYHINTNLFLFAYDWRKDLRYIATQDDDNDPVISLKKQIDKIVENGDKINIIAHSQGGLVVKKLLQDKPEYQSKIDKLIFVGVPNLGAPKVAKALLYGDSMDVKHLGMGLDPEEVKYIAHNMPAVYELLPTQEYFSHVLGYLGNLQTLPSGIQLLGFYDYLGTKEALVNQGLNGGLINQAESFHDVSYDNFDFSSLSSTLGS